MNVYRISFRTRSGISRSGQVEVTAISRKAALSRFKRENPDLEAIATPTKPEVAG